MLNKIIIFFIFTLIFGSYCEGQNYPSFQAYWEPITKNIQEDNHYEAYYLINEALKYQQSQDTLNFLAGKSAMALNAYSKAESHFKALRNSEFEERHPEIDFLLAELQYSQGRYTESLVSYQAYLAKSEIEEGNHQLSLHRLDQVKWAKSHLNTKDPLIKMKKMEGGVNTKESESGPMLSNGELYFSGLRTDPKKKSAQKTKPKGKIFKYDEKNGVTDTLETGLVEKDIFVANPSFSSDRTKFIYSQCNYKENSTNIECELYFKVFENGKWNRPIKLPEEVNQKNSSSTQASLVKDPISGLDRLYFASNRPDGMGGYDIYTVLFKDDGSCSAAENLEMINTPGDEFSPYYSGRTKSLYFSSNYHNGFGGLDVFKYSWKGKDSLKVINLGPSINSSYDELSYNTAINEKTAYLVSNKPGSAYVDELLQACCFDIYKVNITPATVELLVWTKDAFDSLELNGVKLKLIDITESDSLVTTLNFDDRAQFNFKLVEGRNYKIVASREGYESDSIKLTTIDLPNFDPIKREIFLIERKQLNVSTFERTTNIWLKGVKVELWDTDKNQLLKEMTNPDSNFFNFELLKGRNYKLIASKKKYESDMITISAKETAAEKILNRKMFLELSAIAELRKLLPIRLFFDNDMPNPRSESDTTNVLFSKIYNDYVAKKGKYTYEFTHVLKGPIKERTILEIDTFFELGVKANGDKLEIFMDKLQIILEEGHDIDIFLKGYASPRAKSDYNQKLSSRRVNSIRNEFDTYNNSSFHPFIKSQSLKIKEIPFGESMSGNDVSDSLEDTRNSIYSLKAAYERRVEILEILKGVDDQGKL